MTWKFHCISVSQSKEMLLDTTVRQIFTAHFTAPATDVMKHVEGAYGSFWARTDQPGLWEAGKDYEFEMK